MMRDIAIAAMQSLLLKNELDYDDDDFIEDSKGKYTRYKSGWQYSFSGTHRLKPHEQRIAIKSLKLAKALEHELKNQ